MTDARLTSSPDEHECFYRGCTELVRGRYHCDRHEAVLASRRAVVGRRNAERMRRLGHERGTTETAEDA